MKYNFDEIVSRTHTDCLKFDRLQQFYGREDLLPMWIADMDFKTPPFIVKALRERLEHEVFGYTDKCEAWKPSIQRWEKMRYGWEIEAEAIEHVSGIVPAIAFAIQALTAEGDGILIQPPIYPPYFHVPELNGRKVVTNPLKLVEGQYEIDFDDFEQQARQSKLFLLCHPHNPAGRVWRREELERMAEICHREQVVVISDEIHADMTFKGFRHIPFAMVSDKAASNSITMKAASKSFNIAGLISSYVIIPDPELRARYNGFLMKSELNHAHVFATIATAAALCDEGAEWLSQMIDYVTANVDYLQAFLDENMPLLKMIRPQASFLVFLDCSKLNLSSRELQSFFTDKAHLALNEGSTFGDEGAGFMRMNVGCPRATLQQALDRLHAAYCELIEK